MHDNKSICDFCGHPHPSGFYCGHGDLNKSGDFCICTGLRHIERPAPQILRPGWDLIWMEFAGRLSERSTCRRTSVGCVVVSEDNSAVLGMGYNGGAKGLQNDCLSDEPGKCGHLHAEINALIKTNYRDASPKKVYVTLSPCYNCAVALVNAGVREVIYRDEYRDLTGVRLLSEAGLKIRRFPNPGVPARDPYLDQDR